METVCFFVLCQHLARLQTTKPKPGYKEKQQTEHKEQLFTKINKHT